VDSIERLKGKAQQFKGKVEQAVGRATGSKTTQARGLVDEGNGKALEALMDIKGGVKKGAGEAQKRLTAIGSRAKKALAGLDRAGVAAAVGAVVMIAVYRVLSLSRRTS
jgi:uncharacterized protein YjbJ (UPF0337 family)